MHNARPRGSLGFYVGSDEPPKTITSKAGLRDLSVRSEVGQDALTACLTAICARTSSTSCSRWSARSFSSPLPLRLLLSCAEEIVGDIERDENGEAEHVALRGRSHRGPHLLVDVRGELGDVPLVETAADRIALSGDFDGDYAHRLRCSSCSSMSLDARADHLAFAAQRRRSRSWRLRNRRAARAAH